MQHSVTVVRVNARAGQEYVLRREQEVRAPLARVFEFFSDARNLGELTPPWLAFELISSAPIEMRAGLVIEYRLRVRGLPLRWASRIDHWDPGRAFVDTQLRGPYRSWVHTHEFDGDARTTLIRDTVRYTLPLGPLGGLVHRIVVRRDVERIFDYRQARTAALLEVASQP